MTIFEVVFMIAFLGIWITYVAYFLVMVHFSRKTVRTRSAQIFPSVTLLIPTYNEEGVILRKLQNVSELDYPKDKIEVLIVDSASTDKTLECVKEFVKDAQERMDIKILTQDERTGKASALNYALRFCNKELFALSDADVSLEKSAIKQIASHFADERVGAVSGIEVMMNPDQTGTTRVEQAYRSFYNTIRLGETNLDSVLMCESEFSAYRRDLIKELPEKSICDDMELTFQVKEKGFRALYDPKVRFYECSPFKQETRVRHKMRRGQGNQQTLLRHWRMMFNKKCGLFSSVILPFEIFIHVISPILIFLGLFSFILSLVFGSALFLALFLTPFGLATLAIAHVLMRYSPATSITLERSSKKLKMGSSLTMILDFMLLQAALLLSLINLTLGRTEYKWKKVEEIRSI